MKKSPVIQLDLEYFWSRRYTT